MIRNDIRATRRALQRFNHKLTRGASEPIRGSEAKHTKGRMTLRQSFPRVHEEEGQKTKTSGETGKRYARWTRLTKCVLVLVAGKAAGCCKALR
jgi:hypothetical protein